MSHEKLSLTNRNRPTEGQGFVRISPSLEQWPHFKGANEEHMLRAREKRPTPPTAHTTVCNGLQPNKTISATDVCQFTFQAVTCRNDGNSSTRFDVQRGQNRGSEKQGPPPPPPLFPLATCGRRRASSSLSRSNSPRFPCPQ